MELKDEETLKFIQDKLTRDYNEIRDELKYLINDKYNQVMNAKNIDEQNMYIDSYAAINLIKKYFYSV